MSDPPNETSSEEPGAGTRLPLAFPIAVVGALLHQIAVYAPVFEVGTGPEAFSRSILEFTDGVRAALPHLAVSLLGLSGAFMVTRLRGLAAGLLTAAGTMALVTFAIAGRGVWWTADAGSLPIHARFGLYLGIGGAVLLLAAAVLTLPGVVSGRSRTLPVAVLASFALGGWLLPWLAWGAADAEPPAGLDVGGLVWLGRSAAVTVFLTLALALAGWHLTRSSVLARGLAALTGLAIILLAVGVVSGWSLVRILHAGAWGVVGAVAGLYVAAVLSALPRPGLAAAMAMGGLGLLAAGLLVPVLTTEAGTFRPIPLGDVPVAELLPAAINQTPALALAALGTALLGHRGLASGLLVGAAVAALPWSLLYPFERLEIGMWLLIGGLALVLAAAWAALRPAAPTSERPGSAPPSPR